MRTLLTLLNREIRSFFYQPIAYVVMFFLLMVAGFNFYLGVLLLNGQPFSAIFNLILIVFCAIFGLVFHVLLLVPSAHALIAVHMKREERRHREVVEAIRQHGPPPGYPR